MKPKLITAITAMTFLTTGANAQSITGIQNHPVQDLFMAQPCGEVIKTIYTTETSGLGISEMAMAFGFLMGFEASHPRIRGDKETVLIRLRDDCAEHKNKTAMELLEGYADHS